MLKAAIEKIQELTSAKTFMIEGKTFADKPLEEVNVTPAKPDTVKLTSLDALVQIVKKEAISTYSEHLFITVPFFNQVTCFTATHNIDNFIRFNLYEAYAVDVPGWDADVKLPFEQASIALQTRCQETVDRDYALRLCSQISCGGKVTYNDNGIATSVVTQKGVALQGTETIKPLIRLKPYRTFQEVSQPESIFLIRIDERGISFIEADGGMWKLAARQTVKKYLEEALQDEINDGRISVAL